MEEKIINLIGEITQLSIKLNKEHKDDIFVNYSGHVDLFEVSHIPGGFNKNKFMSRKVFQLYIRNVQEDIDKLETVKELLLKMLENKNEPLEKVQG